MSTVIPYPSSPYPPPPWRLQGESVQALRLVDIDAARAFVPAQLRIVPLLPGRTLGVLYCAYYDKTSALSYHELIVAPALTYMHGRLGFWISHIYVDHPASIAGGREIWGLPKEAATFRWAPREGHVKVERHSMPLCEIHWTTSTSPARAGLPRLRFPVFVPAISARKSRWVFFRGSGSAGSLTKCDTMIAVGARSPFRALGFDRTRSALHVANLRLSVAAPSCLGSSGVASR